MTAVAFAPALRAVAAAACRCCCVACERWYFACRCCCGLQHCRHAVTAGMLSLGHMLSLQACCHLGTCCRCRHAVTWAHAVTAGMLSLGHMLSLQTCCHLGTCYHCRHAVTWAHAVTADMLSLWGKCRGLAAAPDVTLAHVQVDHAVHACNLLLPVTLCVPAGGLCGQYPGGSSGPCHSVLPVTVLAHTGATAASSTAGAYLPT